MTVPPRPPARIIAAGSERFVVERSAFERGVSLVEASAGTGKTFNIAMSIVRLLLERDVEGRPLVKGIGSILVVTFTVAATDELVARIRTLLRHANEVYQGRPTSASNATAQLLLRLANGREPFARERVAEALAEVDTLAVFTIHGFCKRVLEEFALESGTAFGASLVEDDEPLLVEALQHWWRLRFYDDEALAAFAVSKAWGPTSFMKQYRLWRRISDVRLEPSESLDAVRQTLAMQLSALAALWRARGASIRAQLRAITWNKGAPCARPGQLEKLDILVEEAARGDLATAVTVADMLCVEELQRYAGKRGNEAKAAHAALADLDVAKVASQVKAVLDRLEQALRVDCFAIAHARLRDEKQRRNLLGFDDLLEKLSRALVVQGPHGLLARAIRAQFHAALIDEFQDTDLHQFRIFETAFHGLPLFLIGDPKQAIYAFRGADVHAYLAAAETAAHRFTLDHNHRSTSRMVEAVNAVFQQRHRAFVEEAMSFHPAQAAGNPGPLARLDGTHALHWLFVGPDERKGTLQPTTYAQAQQLTYAASIRHMKAQLAAGWKAGQLAVLVRTTSEGVAMADLLRAEGIPAVVSGLGNVLQSTEMAELQLVLEAIAAPRHESRVRAALATSLWGADSTDLLRLTGPGAEDQWEQLLNDLSALRDIWLSRGTLQLLQSLYAARHVLTRFMGCTNGDRRMTNLRHVTELVHAAAVADDLNADGVLRWIATRRADAEREREIAELRLETDAEAVQILTIHKSKGLQFDIVYCPTLYHAFPLKPDEPRLVHEPDGVVFDHWSPRYAERTERANMERLAEDCRLAYVALTRARFRTYVGWGVVGSQGKGAWDSALSYLLCDDAGLDSLSSREQPTVVASWFKQDLTRWEPVLRRFTARHSEHMAMEVVESMHLGTAFDSGARGAAALIAARDLPGDPVPAVRFDTYSVTSFTGLTHGARTTEAARDVDDARETGAFTSATEFMNPRDLPASDFRSFPAGRWAGTVLHTLFETSAFDDSVEVLRERATWRLLRTRLAADEADPRIEAVVRMMRAVFDAPLAPWPVHLAQVPAARTRHEWEFLLPFADARRAFMRQRIADQFERFGGEDGVRYAARLRTLSAARVHGFLTGFVDLVFEHAGRWYVVDWKSNQLGANPAAYTREALQEVMESHHYVLQYHLYLVALHRYLTLRLPDYDYDRHVGGAGYAFLRGFETGASVSGHGWYTERPDRSLIEALSALMDRPTAEVVS